MKITPFHIVRVILIAALLTIAYMAWQQKLSVPDALLYAMLTCLIISPVFVIGAAKIQLNFYFRSYNNGNKQQFIALTFDDGPNKETARILDILKAKNVQAAFFSIGKNAAAQPELVKRWIDEGHVVGNHSYYHSFNFDWKSSKAMVDEIEQTNREIKAITGNAPKLFRPPYGVTNPNLGRAVMRTGMYSIGWNIRSYDTVAKDRDKLLNKVLGSIRGGDIILLHDSMAITADILAELIDKAREKGFTFVRVDKLLDIEAYA